jgi:hypothetical protein
MSIEHWRDESDGKTEARGGKGIALLLRSPQILHRRDWNRARTPSVTGRQLGGVGSGSRRA